MSKPQQAGFLDRVFNSTISLPQQVIWRIIRALEDDKVDLFSEKGLLDAALIPVLGMKDDHKEDVMPDYMAKQMGFGDGFVGELSAAILSDPLTYLTGGLTAAGKLGKSVSKVAGSSKAPALTKVLQAAATKADVSMSQFGRDTTVEALGGHIDEAIAALRSGPTATQASNELKTLVKARKDITSHAAAAADDLGSSPSMYDALQKTRDRQIAIGVPGLASFGAKFNVSPGYSSWWTRFADGVKDGGSAIAESALTRTIAETIPGARTAGKAVAAPFRHAAAGWKVGGESRVTFSEAAEQMTKEELSGYERWTNKRTGAADIVKQIVDSKGDIKAKVIAAYKANTKLGDTNEEAFRKAMITSGIGKSSESGAAIWGRLSGRGSESTFFPKWNNASKGGKAIDKGIDTAVTGWSKANELSESGIHNIHAEDTELGQVFKVFAAERSEMTPTLAALSEQSYKTASAFRQAINVAFKTGERTSHGQKAYNEYLAHTARDNDHLEALAEGLHGRIGEIVDLPGHDLTRRDIEKLFGSMMQLETLPGEMAATMKSSAVNADNAQAASVALGNLMHRHRSTMNTFQKLLKEGGITDEAIRGRLSSLFNDEVFPFLERQGEVKIGAHFVKRVKQATRVVNEPTLQDKTRLRRGHNKHVIVGAEVEEGVASPRFSGDVAPDRTRREQMLAEHNEETLKFNEEQRQFHINEGDDPANAIQLPLETDPDTFKTKSPLHGEQGGPDFIQHKSRNVGERPDGLEPMVVRDFKDLDTSFGNFGIGAGQRREQGPSAERAVV